MPDILQFSMPLFLPTFYSICEQIPNYVNLSYGYILLVNWNPSFCLFSYNLFLQSNLNDTALGKSWWPHILLKVNAKSLHWPTRLYELAGFLIFSDLSFTILLFTVIQSHWVPMQDLSICRFLYPKCYFPKDVHAHPLSPSSLGSNTIFSLRTFLVTLFNTVNTTLVLPILLSCFIVLHTLIIKRNIYLTYLFFLSPHPPNHKFHEGRMLYSPRYKHSINSWKMIS